jgi:hypothetical protein
MCAAAHNRQPHGWDRCSSPSWTTPTLTTTRLPTDRVRYLFLFDHTPAVPSHRLYVYVTAAPPDQQTRRKCFQRRRSPEIRRAPRALWLIGEGRRPTFATAIERTQEFHKNFAKTAQAMCSSLVLSASATDPRYPLCSH